MSNINLHLRKSESTSTTVGGQRAPFVCSVGDTEHTHMTIRLYRTVSMRGQLLACVFFNLLPVF